MGEARGNPRSRQYRHRTGTWFAPPGGPRVRNTTNKRARRETVVPIKNVVVVTDKQGKPHLTIRRPQPGVRYTLSDRDYEVQQDGSVRRKPKSAPPAT